MLTVDALYQQNGPVAGLLFFLLFFIVMVAAGEAGYWLGRRGEARSRETAKPNEPAKSTKEHMNVIQTAVFAVLGLLLAFTFSMTVARFDNRKQALLSETNAIGTAYLRTQLLPEPQRTATVNLMRHYVDDRLASGRPNWYLNTSLSNETSALQQQMWSLAVSAAQQDPRAVTTGLYIQSLNDMIDAQGIRDAARLDTLPATAVYLLFAVSVLGVGLLGYAAGLGSGRSLAGTILLALLIALVVVIILDMDNPDQGFITISQQILLTLRHSMGNGP